MFYVRYMASELRRRKGRTILTALGLGIGVGLVVAITSLSAGLSQAQDEVLKPLTGVGTDMSVNRPITVNRSSGGSRNFSAGGAGLSSKEQKQLRKENGSVRLDFSKYGDPGEKFKTRQFVSTDLSFADSQATQVENISGIKGVGRALTLNQLTISGTVPESGSSHSAAGPLGGAGGGPGTGFDQASVTGIDASQSSLAPMTPSQIVNGKYLPTGSGNNAVISQTYAQSKGLGVGDTVAAGKRKFKIVGIAKPPLGGKTSDIYVPLTTLQKMSNRVGRINILQVRADSADQVDSVAKQIKTQFPGSQVTTASDLADSVSGSLVDAKNLSNKLGSALAIVALLAAFAIASLLTLSSVNKRTRELGTLKAIGWRQRLVIRQICGESVAQGLLGGIAGALIGIGAAALVGAMDLTLKASVASQVTPGPGSFGQGSVSSGSTLVSISAPVQSSALFLAICLAVLGGLIAGAIGSARVARLRPAEALRSVE